MAQGIDQQALPDKLAGNRKGYNWQPIGRPEWLAKKHGEPSHHRQADQARPEQQRPTAQHGPTALRKQDVKGIEKPGEQAEQVADQGGVIDLQAAPQQQCRAHDCRAKGEPFGRAGPAAQSNQPPGRDQDRSGIPEQRGIAKPGEFDPQVPARKVQCEEHAAGKDPPQHAARGTGQRLAIDPGEQHEERHGQRQSPEPG